MQLGRRWRAGEPPHPGVPGSLHTAIASQEAEFPEGRSWTMTWLEGLARCELDGLVRVAQTPGDGVQVSRLGEPDDDEDDDWLQ